MDVKTLRSGMQCTLSDGSLAEVQGILPDNVHVRVRYLDTLDNPEIRIGEVREVPFEELIAEYMGTTPRGSRSDIPDHPDEPARKGRRGSWHGVPKSIACCQGFLAVRRRGRCQ